MRHPRPAAALDSFAADRAGDRPNNVATPNSARRRRRRTREGPSDAAWAVARVVFQQKHLDFLDQLPVARQKLGIHDKRTAVVRGLVHALQKSELDLAGARSEAEIADTVADALKVGMAVERNELVRALPPETREAVEKHAARIGRSLPEVVATAVGGFLEHGWLKPKARRNGSISKRDQTEFVQRRGTKWFRPNVSAWDVTYNASETLFPTPYQEAVEVEDWQVDKKSVLVFLSHRGRVQAEIQMLIRSTSGRVALLREKTCSEGRRSNLYADGRHEINLERVPGVLEELETLPPWDAERVLKKMCPYQGETTLRFPDFMRGGGDPQKNRNEIVRRLVRLGVQVVQVAYWPLLGSPGKTAVQR